MYVESVENTERVALGKQSNLFGSQFGGGYDASAPPCEKCI